MVPTGENRACWHIWLNKSIVITWQVTVTVIYSDNPPVVSVKGASSPATADTAPARSPCSQQRAADPSQAVGITGLEIATNMKKCQTLLWILNMNRLKYFHHQKN